jgi:hypothetical protein
VLLSVLATAGVLDGQQQMHAINRVMKSRRSACTASDDESHQNCEIHPPLWYYNSDEGERWSVVVVSIS